MRQWAWWTDNGRAERLVVGLIQAWTNRDAPRAAVLVKRANSLTRFDATVRLTDTVLCDMKRGGGEEIQIARSVDKGESYDIIDTDDAPPFVRALGRFVMAVGNGDRDTARAVWESMPEQDQIHLVLQLTSLAGKHLVVVHGLKVGAHHVRP